jgi:hypothetical protein
LWKDWTILRKKSIFFMSWSFVSCQRRVSKVEKLNIKIYTSMCGICVCMYGEQKVSGGLFCVFGVDFLHFWHFLPWLDSFSPSHVSYVIHVLSWWWWWCVNLSIRCVECKKSYDRKIREVCIRIKYLHTFVCARFRNILVGFVQLFAHCIE